MEYKGYLITHAQGAAKCYSIATAGQGGKIPQVMVGLFTSAGVAKQVIDMYIVLKQKNVKTDDKEISKI